MSAAPVWADAGGAQPACAGEDGSLNPPSDILSDPVINTMQSTLGQVVPATLYPGDFDTLLAQADPSDIRIILPPEGAPSSEPLVVLIKKDGITYRFTFNGELDPKFLAALKVLNQKIEALEASKETDEASDSRMHWGLIVSHTLAQQDKIRNDGYWVQYAFPNHEHVHSPFISGVLVDWEGKYGGLRFGYRDLGTFDVNAWAVEPDNVYTGTTHCNTPNGRCPKAADFVTAGTIHDFEASAVLRAPLTQDLSVYTFGGLNVEHGQTYVRVCDAKQYFGVNCIHESPKNNPLFLKAQFGYGVTWKNWSLEIEHSRDEGRAGSKDFSAENNENTLTINYTYQFGPNASNSLF